MRSDFYPLFNLFTTACTKCYFLVVFLLIWIQDAGLFWGPPILQSNGRRWLFFRKQSEQTLKLLSYHRIVTVIRTHGVLPPLFIYVSRTYLIKKFLPASLHRRVGTLIVATIYLQLIQNRYMFRSFTVLQYSHQHCVQPVASDVQVVGYL